MKNHISSAGPESLYTEKWLRFLPRQFSQLGRADSGLAVIIPFNARHFAKIGKASQAELTGPGQTDVKVVVPKDETGPWEFPLALSYCAQQLNGFVAAQRDRKMSAYRHVMYERAEHLPGAFLGRPMTTLSDMLGLEIILPDQTFGSLISESENNIDAYLLLNEIGLQCLENGQIDVQPAPFRDWFFAVTTGVISTPGKRPENWKIDHATTCCSR